MYRDPQLWYVDINLDVQYTKTQKQLRLLRAEGWKVATHDSWTHFNQRDMRHTNIDLIIYRNFDDYSTIISLLGFNRKFSDHIPI